MQLRVLWNRLLEQTDALSVAELSEFVRSSNTWLCDTYFLKIIFNSQSVLKAQEHIYLMKQEQEKTHVNSGKFILISSYFELICRPKTYSFFQVS